MIGGTLAFSPASSLYLLETTDSNANKSIRSSSSLRKSLNFNPGISCSASSSSSPPSRSHGHGIPKLEPFSRTKLERAIKEPPFIEKSQRQLADYCSVLEGEDSYDCWKAYFELKDLEKEAPKQEVERLIIQAGGEKSLVKWVHGFASIYKAKKEACKAAKKEMKATNEERSRPTHIPDGIPRHIPDGIPRPLEEIEEEEAARMSDSPFTRLLRVMGKYPAWYTPPPDHETH